MSGFRLHVGGTFDYEHPITYVGGTMIDDWDIEPESLTLDTLHRTIDIVGYQGSVLTIHYCKPGVRLGEGLYPVDTEEDVRDLVLAWKMEGSIDIFVEHSISNVDDFLGDSVGNNRGSTSNDPKSAEDDVPDPDEESDEEWLEDVEYASEHENDELNEYMENAKQYVRSAAKPKNCKRNTAGQLEPDSDSGSEYSVGMDYEDNDDLNWSLTDEEDLDVDVEELRQDAGQVPGHRWRKSKKCYYDPERPALRLHMIFKDPAQFREALVDNSIESGHPFKYWNNFGKKIQAKCVNIKDGCQWHGAEVKEGKNTYVVKTLSNSCSCRAWDLQGIPSTKWTAAQNFTRKATKEKKTRIR
ncbi:hypothetical protein ACFE04_027411 [Oxalis oulophora]